MVPLLLFTAALVVVASSSVVPVIEDFHYPIEEHAELEAVSSVGLTVVALSINSNSTGKLTLSTANGTNATVHTAGEWIFGWRLRGFLIADVHIAAAGGRATLAVLEYEASRWGRLEFVAIGGRVGAAVVADDVTRPGLALRKGVGRIDQVRRPRYHLRGVDPEYFNKADEDPTDWIKQSMQNASAFGETTFEAAASRMVPTQEYTITGNANAHTKFSVSPDGRVYLGNFSIYAGADHHPNVTGTALQPGVLLFDPKQFVSWWPSAGGNFSETKTSIVGRYTRAITVAAWDVPAQRGFSVVVVPNTRRGINTRPYDTAELLVRLEESPRTRAGASPPPRYFSVEGCVTAGSAVDNATTNTTHGGTLGLLCIRPGYCKPVVRCQPEGSADAVVELDDGGALFHAHMLAHASQWTELFDGVVNNGARIAGTSTGDNAPRGITNTSSRISRSSSNSRGAIPAALPSRRAALSVSLRYAPNEAARLVDMARGTLVAAMTTFLGPRPNYGDGATYWSVSLADRGALPLESYALNHGLLLWGLVDEAGVRIEYYLRHYVRAANGMVPELQVDTNSSAGPPGSIDLKHWNDECTFADSLADLGRWLELWVDAARAQEAGGVSGVQWVVRTWPQIKLMAGYILALRSNATATGTGVSKGLIYGPAEFDECTHQQHWFSISSWAWRGLLQLQRFLLDTAVISEQPMAARLFAECAAFKTDLDAARNASMVVIRPGNTSTSNTAQSVPSHFVPPYAVANMTPYTEMPYSNRGTDVQDYGGGAAYANFRYFSEMLSSQFLGAELDHQLNDFRESHLGTMSGMTRFRTHLDDMPATGYAYSAAATDRTKPFLSLLFGHIANYQSRGSFNAPEQLSFTGDGPTSDSVRDIMSPGISETDIDMCVPSSTLVAFMVRWMLVFEERDADVVWLLKMAPRRFYPKAADAHVRQNSSFVHISGAPTRFGHVSYTVNSVNTSAIRLASSPTLGLVEPLHLETTVILELNGRGVVDAAAGGLVIRVRLRDPAGTRRVRTALLLRSSSSHVTVGSINGAAETIQINIANLQKGVGSQTNFTVLTTLQ
jgi:hypothetical protein